MIINIVLSACLLGNVPIGGLYYPDTGVIEICSTMTKYQQRIAIRHEVGHKIWFEKLTQEQRDRWARARERVLTIMGLEYLYSHPTSPGLEEDFAYFFQDYYYGQVTDGILYDILKLFLK